MRLLLFALLLMSAGCGKHSDGTSVWAEGLFLVALLPFLGSLYFFYTAYKASKSNSTTQVGTTVIDNTGNVPIYKTGRFWFGVALIVATIAIIWAVNSDK